MTEEIQNTLKIIPHSPGCYQFIDKKGKVIYVGKAKDLKKRVSSYFNRANIWENYQISCTNDTKIKELQK